MAARRKQDKSGYFFCNISASREGDGREKLGFVADVRNGTILLDVMIDSNTVVLLPPSGAAKLRAADDV